jgi:hypothetical protein
MNGLCCGAPAMAVISDNVITVRDFQSIGMLSGMEEKSDIKKKEGKENGPMVVFGCMVQS